MAPTEDVRGRLGLVALLSAAIVLTAVAIEVFAGAAANTPSSSWVTRFVPLTWPKPVRAGWWLVVAAAALSYRLSLRRLGFPQRWWIVIASVLPFVVFAGGVATGSEWSTWH